MYPDDLFYTEEHEWVRVENGGFSLGITKFAQDELGDIVFVELPTVGSSFDAEDEIGSIESVKAVAEIFTPLSGEVVEVNEALVERPELLNQDPHGDGWLVRMKTDSEPDVSGLMNSGEYQEFVFDSDED